jgi:hypothetical protein
VNSTPIGILLPVLKDSTCGAAAQSSLIEELVVDEHTIYKQRTVDRTGALSMLNGMREMTLEGFVSGPPRCSTAYSGA